MANLSKKSYDEFIDELYSQRILTEFKEMQDKGWSKEDYDKHIGQKEDILDFIWKFGGEDDIIKMHEENTRPPFLIDKNRPYYISNRETDSKDVMGLFKQKLLEHFAAEGAHMLQDSEYNRSEKEIDKYWNSFAGLVDSLMKSENISTYDARERTYDIPTSMEGIAHGKSGNENLQDTITNLINLNENFDVTHRVGFIDTVKELLKKQK